jgi:hypothetical protein
MLEKGCGFILGFKGLCMFFSYKNILRKMETMKLSTLSCEEERERESERVGYFPLKENDC